MGFILCHIIPLVNNGLGGRHTHADTHTHTYTHMRMQTHILTCQAKAILRNQASIHDLIFDVIHLDISSIMLLTVILPHVLIAM